MPTEVHRNRELARSFWSDEPAACPKHKVAMPGRFVETTYADHIVFDCPKGRETYTIPQRPRQKEFNPRQVEGLVFFMERRDSVRCYRCQSVLEIDMQRDRTTGSSAYIFTCVRCFSWGSWTGRPEEASIEAPTVATE